MALEVIKILPPYFLMGCLILLAVFLASIILIGFWIVKNRDVKLKDIEIVTNSQKELFKTEGKNTLDNQTNNAHHLLKKVWIDIYDAGRKKFNITDDCSSYRG